jgi:multidrug efflux pump subunit AcrA (membrane-fusion protein)
MMSKNTPHDISPKPLNIAGLVLAVVAVVVAVAGIIIRFSHTDDLQKEVESQHVTVKVVLPQTGSSIQKLILPVNVRADIDAPIYARVNGYLKAWYTDIGARVTKGQLLGEIETPQQILRARARMWRAPSPTGRLPM